MRNWFHKTVGVPMFRAVAAMAFLRFPLEIGGAKWYTINSTPKNGVDAAENRERKRT